MNQESEAGQATDGPSEEDIRSRLVIAPFAKPKAGLMRLAPLPRDPEGSVTGNPVTAEPERQPRERRSAKTEEQYAQRVKSMYRESSRRRTFDPEIPADVSPVEVVQDLIESASGTDPRRGAASWTLYRAAMLWHLAERRNTNGAYEEAHRMLVATKQPPGAKPGGARRKKKTIPEDDLLRIYEALDAREARGANWGLRTKNWLQAALATGLRPVEWLEARWASDDEVRALAHPDGELDLEHDPRIRWLRVKNAKLKRVGSALEVMSGRSGTIHEIPLEDLPAGDFYDPRRQHRFIPVDPWEQEIVDAHMATVRQCVADLVSAEQLEPETAFERYYNVARQTLSHICAKLFKGKRFYGLYHARSQYAANAKNEMDLEDVAARMGHTGKRRTMSNYGPQSAGHRGRAMKDLAVEQLNQMDAIARQARQATHRSDGAVDARGTPSPARLGRQRTGRTARSTRRARRVGSGRRPDPDHLARQTTRRPLRAALALEPSAGRAEGASRTLRRTSWREASRCSRLRQPALRVEAEASSNAASADAEPATNTSAGAEPAGRSGD